MLILCDVGPGAEVAFGAALLVVAIFAAARLLPYLARWLRAKDDIAAADIAELVAFVALEHEHGDSFLDAMMKAAGTPQARDLIARAVAKAGAAQ